MKTVSAYDVPHTDRPKFLAHYLWHCLRNEDNLPKLSEAGKSDLSLIKEYSCLLDLRKGNVEILLLGNKLRQYSGFEGLNHGDELSLDEDSVAGPDMQRMIDGLFVTFEMGEPHYKRPWLCLPFADEDPEACAFILCVHADDSSERDELEPRDWLDAARIRQRHSRAGRADSHDPLYETLACIYAAAVAARHDPRAFEALLKEHGLRAQARAPYTPLLKIVFGKEYDKTRFAEYAAALSWLKRNAVAPRDAAATFKSFPGGIKGCVQEERRVRRQKSGSRKDLADLLKRAGLDEESQERLRFGMLQTDEKGHRPQIQYEIGPDNPNFTNICKAFEKALEHERSD